MLAWGTRPVGAAVGGAIGQVAGVRAVFVVMTVTTLVALVPGRRLTKERLASTER